MSFFYTILLLPLRRTLYPYTTLFRPDPGRRALLGARDSHPSPWRRARAHPHQPRQEHPLRRAAEQRGRPVHLVGEPRQGDRLADVGRPGHLLLLLDDR